METSIITVTNAKGGTGKTTAVAAIASILCNVYGLRVLVVDLCANHGLTFLLLGELPASPSFHLSGELTAG